MAKVTRLTDQEDTEVGFVFECPGCGISHMPRVSSKSGAPCWTFNGDVEKPTFEPSILVRWEKPATEDLPRVPVVCHSFVREGKIEFLGDCTHALAGKTVVLPDLGDDWLA